MRLFKRGEEGREKAKDIRAYKKFSTRLNEQGQLSFRRLSFSFQIMAQQFSRDADDAARLFSFLSQLDFYGFPVVYPHDILPD